MLKITIDFFWKAQINNGPEHLLKKSWSQKYEGTVSQKKNDVFIKILRLHLRVQTCAKKAAEI